MNTIPLQDVQSIVGGFIAEALHNAPFDPDLYLDISPPKFREDA